MKYVAIPQNIFNKMVHEAARSANEPDKQSSCYHLLRAQLRLADIITITPQEPS